MEGLWKRWHPNGKLESEGEFQDSKKEGVWKHWEEDGTPKSDIRWKNGKEVIPEPVSILRETTHPCIIYKEVPEAGSKYKLCTFSEEHVHDYDFLSSQPAPVTRCYYCQNPLRDAVYQQP
jgi:hypothetical protein